MSDFKLRPVLGQDIAGPWRIGGKTRASLPLRNSRATLYRQQLGHSKSNLWIMSNRSVKFRTDFISRFLVIMLTDRQIDA